MKVLLTATSSWPAIGGIETSLHAIARVLMRSGHDVRVLSLVRSDHPREVLHDGIAYRYVPYETSRLTHVRVHSQQAAIAAGFEGAMGRWSPRLVLSRSPATTLAMDSLASHAEVWHLYATTARLSSAGSYSGSRLTSWPRRAALRVFGEYDYLVRRQLDRRVGRCARPIVFSKFMRDRLQMEGICPEYRAEIIRPGIDKDRFRPPDRDACRSFRQRWEIPQDAPVALYVGRISRQKNVHFLLDVLRNLENVILVLVGTGPEEGRFKLGAKRMGIESRVRCIGSLTDDLPIAYGQADVCLLPSRIESFGQTIVESLGCGTPVIAHGHAPKEGLLTAADEILKDPIHGRVVHRYEASEFAAHAESVIGAGSHAGELCSDAHDRFDWGVFVNSWLSLSRCGDDTVARANERREDGNEEDFQYRSTK